MCTSCITLNRHSFFIPVLITDKVLGTIASSYHLLERPLKAYTSKAAYEFFEEIHESSHKIEPLLHMVCLGGEIASIFQGTYVEYDKKSGKIDRLRTAGKVCHSASHCLSCLSICSKGLKLFDLTDLGSILKYQTTLSIIGYGLLTAALIWKRFQHSREEGTLSNRDQDNKDQEFWIGLRVYAGGFLADALPLTKKWSVCKDDKQIKYMINLFASAASLVHCISSLALIDRIRGGKGGKGERDHEHTPGCSHE